jgi:O-antigen/teichoic acid export membrane protein
LKRQPSSSLESRFWLHMAALHINKNLVLALLTFGFASLTVHVVNDLNHDDKESIQTAGFVGYGMVIAVLLVVFMLSYIAALKKSKQPGLRV